VNGLTEVVLGFVLAEQRDSDVAVFAIGKQLNANCAAQALRQRTDLLQQVRLAFVAAVFFRVDHAGIKIAVPHSGVAGYQRVGHCLHLRGYQHAVVACGRACNRG
jgi:hypothetical protein